ncbi:MAG: hypothetical protein MJA30_37425, partial [Cytophagales bacterium]|nr:hypothetical protein [Cytophagales bacterium]
LSVALTLQGNVIWFTVLQSLHRFNRKMLARYKKLLRKAAKTDCANAIWKVHTHLYGPCIYKRL